MSHKVKVLIIYTGGTIGMQESEDSGSLIPLDFAQIMEFVPELDRFHYILESETFKEPLDSSDVDVSVWVKIANIVGDRYYDYDGFVVLHGTDTMAYTASALSFMLENLNKPVIITGSQLPIGKLRTDGKENLIGSIEMAGAQQYGEKQVREVCVYFGTKLLRGNRTHKYNTEDFTAIESANFPPLADVGTHIFYRNDLMLTRLGRIKVNRDLERNVAILKLFPGITKEFIQRILETPGLKGLIIETYGAGNAPNKAWLIEMIRLAVKRGIRIVNVTQCNKGFVEQGRYETSLGLSRAGVLGSADMTVEAALTKLMCLLGENLSKEQFEFEYLRSVCGELTNMSRLI